MWNVINANGGDNPGQWKRKGSQLDISLEDTREDHSLLVDDEMMIWPEYLSVSRDYLWQREEFQRWLWIPLVWNQKVDTLPGLDDMMDRIACP